MKIVLIVLIFDSFEVSGMCDTFFSSGVLSLGFSQERF